MLIRKRKKPDEIEEMKLKMMELLADGLGCGQLEDKLHITESGIRYHLREIYKELNAKCITNAVSLFERRKYAKLLSALKELAKKNQPLAELLKQFKVL